MRVHKMIVIFCLNREGRELNPSSAKPPATSLYFVFFKQNFLNEPNGASSSVPSSAPRSTPFRPCEP